MKSLCSCLVLVIHILTNIVKGKGKVYIIEVDAASENTGTDYSDDNSDKWTNNGVKWEHKGDKWEEKAVYGAYEGVKGADKVVNWADKGVKWTDKGGKWQSKVIKSEEKGTKWEDNSAKWVDKDAKLAIKGAKLTNKVPKWADKDVKRGNEGAKLADKGENWKDKNSKWTDKGAKWVNKGAKWEDKGAKWADKGAKWVDKDAKLAIKGAKLTNKAPKWADKDVKRENEGAKLADKGEKWKDKNSKWTDKGAKWVNKGAKWEDKVAKWADKGAKRADKGAKSTDKGAKWMDKGVEWKRKSDKWVESYRKKCTLKDWSAWSESSLTCGWGKVSRNRACSDGDKVCEKSECSGKVVDYKNHIFEDCCVWNNWGSWSAPSQICGTVSIERNRACKCGAINSSSITKCGKGDGKETKQKILETCCSWTIWGDWSPSSKTCGITNKRRNRSCKCGSKTSITTQKCGGGMINDQQEDIKAPCCEWTNWGEWSSLSVTCGNGTVIRSRDCSGSSDDTCMKDSCGDEKMEASKELELATCIKKREKIPSDAGAAFDENGPKPYDEDYGAANPNYERKVKSKYIPFMKRSALL